MEVVTGGKSRVLVATGQLVGEGFDLPAMSTLFLATPTRFDGRVLQYIGRVLRPAPGKATKAATEHMAGFEPQPLGRTFPVLIAKWLQNQKTKRFLA